MILQARSADFLRPSKTVIDVFEIESYITTTRSHVKKVIAELRHVYFGSRFDSIDEVPHPRADRTDYEEPLARTSRQEKRSFQTPDTAHRRCDKWRERVERSSCIW